MVSFVLALMEFLSVGVQRTGVGLLVVWPALRATGRLNGTRQLAG